MKDRDYDYYRRIVKEYRFTSDKFQHDESYYKAMCQHASLIPSLVDEIIRLNDEIDRLNRK